MRKPKADSTALTVMGAGTEVGMLADMAAHANEYLLKSRSKSTLERYAQCWRKFHDWCTAAGADPMPATISTICLYISWLAKEEGFAASSIGQAVAALRFAHDFKRKRPIDDLAAPGDDAPSDPWKDVRLRQVMQGINREMDRPIKRARPITREDMREAFDMLRPHLLREARDAAIFALAYAGCRRRSEITGLDYAKRGTKSDGTGILEINEEGIIINLLRSKTQQTGEPKKYFINRKHAAKSCAAIENWIKLAAIAPGTPVLRGIRGLGRGVNADQADTVGVYNRKDKWQTRWKGKDLGGYATKEEAIARVEAAAAEDGTTPTASLVKPERMCDMQINNVIKRRMFDVLCRRMLADTKRKRLRPEELADCKAQSSEYSGHSGRRGSIRDAFEHGAQRHDVIAMSGHTPGSAMLDLYSQDTDIKKHKFLVGSGL